MPAPVCQHSISAGNLCIDRLERGRVIRVFGPTGKLDLRRQARWLAGLSQFDRLAQEGGADGFANNAVHQQLTLLQTLDDAAYSDGGSAGFYPEFKKRAVRLLLFRTRFDGGTALPAADPGDHRPCLPFAQGDRAWFCNGFAYEL